MYFILILYFAIAFACAIFVYLSLFNQRDKVLSNIFAILSLVTGIWLLFNGAQFLLDPTDVENPLNYLIIRWALFFAVFQALSFYLLSFYLKYGYLKSRAVLIATCLSVVPLTTVLSEYTILSADLLNNTSVVGPGMYVFASYNTVITILGIYFLMSIIKTGSGIRKLQAQIVLIGIAVMFSLLITTVMIPMILTGNHIFSVLMPVYTLFFLVSTWYAITQYRFLDIKLSSVKVIAFLISTAAAIILLTASALVAMLAVKSQPIIIVLVGFGILSILAYRLALYLYQVLSKLLLTDKQLARMKMRERAQRIKFMKINNQLTEEDEHKPALILDSLDTSIQYVMDQYVALMGEEDISLLAADHHTRTFKVIAGGNENFAISPDEEFHRIMLERSKMYIADELQYMIEQQNSPKRIKQLQLVQKYMQKHKLEFIAPLNQSTLIAGYIVKFKQGKGEVQYTTQDVEALNSFRRVCAPYVQMIGAQRTAARDIL